MAISFNFKRVDLNTNEVAVKEFIAASQEMLDMAKKPIMEMLDSTEDDESKAEMTHAMEVYLAVLDKACEVAMRQAKSLDRVEACLDRIDKHLAKK